MKFGQFQIDHFVEREFYLDGGMMFGVVPKVLWERLVDVTDQNLVPFVNHCYLLTAHGKRILLDVGFGDTLEDREMKMYCTDNSSYLERGLADLGLTTDDIDYVLPSHLHTDHAAAAVKQVDGEYVPRFANAKYLICREEWEAAIHPNERTKASYRSARLLPLKEAGQLQLFDADSELFPGVRAVFTGGHTAGHVGIEMESDGKAVWFYGDIFPSVHHLRLPYIAAADLYPMDVLNVKTRLVPRLMNEDVILAFDHDVNVALGRVVETDGRALVEAVSDASVRATG